LKRVGIEELMNKRFVSVLIFAFLVAGCASLLLYRLTLNHMGAQAAANEVKAIVAARNLDLGAVIGDPDVKMVSWPGTLPAKAVMKREDIIGRGVISTIYDGELVMEDRLAPKGAGGGLAGMIPPGMRAVAVRVNDVVGVAGFVTAGMRVDVLISGNPPNAVGTGSQTRTLLQNIEVLSAGQDYKKDSEGKPVLVQVVNLLVSPEQAERLSLAISQTTIQLVLRNPADTKIAATPGTAVTALFGSPFNAKPAAAPRVAGLLPRNPMTPSMLPRMPAPVTQPPARQVFVMEVINGAAKTQSKFVLSQENK
jgi:pilus assembly protein CpaB